jgi:L-threonylcarbamoyladenylate synthase
MLHSSSSVPSLPEAAVLTTNDVGVALERLRRGGLVAIPTETVYGLAADAERPDAVARIFAVKGRPTDHPLIVHLGSTDAMDGWIDPAADARLLEHVAALATACWPGPLTMLVPRGPRVLDVVTGGRPTVGLRVPAHPLTLDLLDRFGGGLAAPSANRFGRVSPTTAGHVLTDLVDHLDPERDSILDGGPCPIGVESTIVDLTTAVPQVLRSGGIDAADVARILSVEVAGASGPSRASGMLIAHYAPVCEVVVVEDAASAAIEVENRHEQRVRVLDRTDDLVLAARTLYADLRRADDDGLDALVAVLPPAEGLGHALRDRLVKASVGSRRDRPSRAG